MSWLFQSLSNLKIRAEGVETGREGAEGPRKRRRAVSRSRVRSRDGDDLQFKRREGRRKEVSLQPLNKSKSSLNFGLSQLEIALELPNHFINPKAYCPDVFAYAPLHIPRYLQRAKKVRRRRLAKRTSDRTFRPMH